LPAINASKSIDGVSMPWIVESSTVEGCSSSPPPASRSSWRLSWIAAAPVVVS